jgi:ATP-dependent 26S proteasome regulatory subunit
MTPFVKDLTTHMLAGQAMMYINSREEGRAVAAIREAGWLMAPSEPAHQERYAERDADIASDVADALALGGVDPRPYQKTRRVDPALFIAAFKALEQKVADSEAEADRCHNAALLLHKVLDTVGFPTVAWDMLAGFDDDNSCQENFREAMGRIGDRTSSLPNRSIVVMKDCHMHINTQESPLYRRAIRNLYEPNLLVTGNLARHVIYLQPYLRPHSDVQHCLVKQNFPLPNDEEIAEEIANAQQGIIDPTKRHCPNELRAELVAALRGLDAANIAKSLAVAVVENQGFAPGMVRRVRALRAAQLSATQGMRIIDPDDPELTMLGSLGGFENVTEVIEEVKFCRTPEAVAAKLIAPSGLALAGPPGTGKTVAGKLIAHWLGVPLVVINMGTTKEGIVGASEANIDASLNTVRALGECVVLFDEWDKQAGGAVGSFSDGNTSGGMLSLVLDFASDPRRRAFLIFTMNRLHGPIESLRAGRISSFFYTPLPDAADREEILTLKLVEQGAVVPKEIAQVATDDMTNGLSGSELTEMTNKAVRLAFMRCRKKEPTLEDFVTARAAVTPVTRLNAEEVAAMEAFKGIAVPVSKPKKKAKTLAQLTQPGKRGIRFNPGNN